MTNINVRVVGTANVTQMGGGFAKLEAQVSALNAQLTKMVALQNGVDPRGYERMTQAASMNSKTFRSAAASTGMFEVQQLRLNKATDDYVTKLQKQKLSFSEMAKQRKLASAAYREQLAMEQMTVRTSQSGTTHGKQMVDVTSPNVIAKDFDTLGRKVAFASAELKSGATQMVNWGKNTQWTGRQMSMGLTMPVVAFGAAAGVMAYQVDQALTRVQKVYNTTAKSGAAQQKELDKVRADGLRTAIDTAKQYGSAGADTLNVQAELAASGKRGNQLQQATTQVMRISRLGELDYNDAIKTTISLQSVFGDSSQQLAKDFNYMNAIENATSLQTADFAKAIPIAAAPVKAFGGDIKELGILLTAMKERGVEATQGANAIKAAMSRLGRPSAQVQSEWTALTNTDITKIFDNSHSLLDLFGKINDATSELTNKEKIKAFSGLFGTYQVTRMMALVNGMQDLKNGVGQVSTAYQLAQQDSSKWAKIAAQETERYQNSISGKWDIAIATMKLQMSTLGKPFVEVATVIISHIAKIINAFNKLPDFAKKAIAVPIIIAAVVGPIAALVGLFSQLIGNAGRLTAAIMGLFGRMKVATIEQRAAALAADKNSVAMTREADSVTLVAAAYEKLNLSQAVANRETRRGVLTGLIGGGMAPRDAVRTVNTVAPMKSMGTATAKVAVNTGKISGSMVRIGAGAGVAALAMGTMAVSSNQTVDKFASLAMYGALLGPSIAEMAMALGPAGPIVLGVVAIGAGIWAWKKHEDAITEAKRQQNLAMYKQKGLLDDALNIDQKRLKTLHAISTTSSPTGQKKGPDFDMAVSRFQNTDEGKGITGAYNAASDAATKANIATNVYYNTINAKHGTAAKAIMAVSAMFVAAGDSIGVADLKARALATDIADLSKQGSGTAMKALFQNDFIQAQLGDSTSAAQQGTEIGKQLMSAMASATTGQAPHLFDGIQAELKGSWKSALGGLDSVSQQVFKDAGIHSRKQFEAMLKDMSPGSGMDMGAIASKYGLDGSSVTKSISAWGKAVFELKSNMANSKGLDVEKAIVKQFTDQLYLSKDIVTISQLRQQWEFKLLFANKQNEKSLAKQELLREKAARGPWWNAMMKGTKLGKQSNDLLNASIQKQIRLAEQANGTWVDAKKKTDDLHKSLNGMPKNVTVSLSIKQSTSVVHDAMASVQDDMATSAMDQFNSRWDAKMQAQQSSFSARSDNLQAHQQAASDSMDKRFQAAQDAMDKKFQARQDAINKAFQDRMDHVAKEIKAEQDADAARQKMYEAEKARMQALADMANKNIDFNTALSQGQFDEAAKIKNDMGAANAANEMDKEEARSAARTQRKIDRLTKKNDQLTKQRDKELKQLQKTEDAQKKHLQAIQDAQKKHLEKMQTAQQASLQKQEDAAVASMQRERDYREAMLQQQLDLFKSFVPKSKAELDKWIKQIGLSYDTFGSDIKAKGKNWSEYFQTSLTDHIQAAGRQIASDNMWTKVGQDMAVKLLNGIGFKSLGAFNKFVKSGNLPKNFGETRHEGGTIGTGGGSRKGVPSNQKGLHHSETYVRAQKGEFMVNKRDAALNKNLLEKINNGQIGDITAKGGFPGGGKMTDDYRMPYNTYNGYGPGAGMVEGTLAHMFMSGFGHAVEHAVKDAKKKQHKANKAARNSGGHITGDGYIPGPGGSHSPSVKGLPLAQGLHDSSTGYPAIDIAAAIGMPAYAVGNGTITESIDYRGYEPRRMVHGQMGDSVQDGYRSYGRMMVETLDSGGRVLYAHLSKRSLGVGSQVKGGSVIGRTGNTGYVISSAGDGAHLHFGATPMSPYAFLREGGEVKWDNTPAVLHKGETVLTQNLTKQFKENVANGGNNNYNIEVVVPGTNVSAQDIANTVMQTIKRSEDRKPRGRRG